MANRIKISEILNKVDSVISEGQYKDNWESLGTYPMPEWYVDAKLGFFIHWGVYSVPAYLNEWYPRFMYLKTTPVYHHHRRKYGKDFDYHQFIPMFQAENFDAEKLVDKMLACGAKYVMPVAEHHDGFKMYKSDLSRWNAYEKGPKRDIIAEFKQACDEKAVDFAVSSHRAENYWFMNGARTIGYDSAVLSEEYRDLYGASHTINNNHLKDIYSLGKGIVPPTEWLEDWLASSVELIDNYQPSAMYFDWWVNTEAFRPYMRKFVAYYYNQSKKWGKNVTVFHKDDACMFGVGTMVRERGQLPQTFFRPWQAETSTNTISWGYVKNDRYKKASDIIANFIDVIAKNGNFVINIGPKPDGTLCSHEEKILDEFAAFSHRNKEGIWGTRPFKVHGEGKKRKYGLFSEKYNYTAKDFRFTYKTGILYVFCLNPKGKNIFKVQSLKRNDHTFNFSIKNATILADGSTVKVEHNSKYLLLTTSKVIEASTPICFKLELE